MSLLLFFVVGMAGALVKDVLVDGYIQLPQLKNNKLFLGFIGSAFVGGCVGVAVDGNYFTAFLSGYVGFSVFSGVLNNGKNLISSNLLKKENGESLRDNNTGGS